MRIRFRFSKLGKIRFTSQRDVARMWERALRRARLPLAYTEGFSPRPQLSFGLALPTGAESLAEYVDVALDPDGPRTRASTWPPSRPRSRCCPTASTSTRRSGGALEDSLQQMVTSCSWTMRLAGLDPGQLADWVDGPAGRRTVTITRERKGRRSPTTSGRRSWPSPWPTAGTSRGPLGSHVGWWPNCPPSHGGSAPSSWSAG